MYKGKIEDSLLITNRLPTSAVGVLNEFQSVTCVLCTLGLMMGETLIRTKILSIIPPIHIIVDEASQIKIVDFMVSSGGFVHLVFLNTKIFLIELTAHLP